MKQETLFKNKVRPKLEKLPNSWWYKTQQVALRGIPDFIGCVQGRMVAIELKKSVKDRPDKLQEKILSDIRECGGVTFVMYPENEEEVLLELRRLFHKP